jgi:hypothetical protein
MTDLMVGVAEDLRPRDVDVWASSLAATCFRGRTALLSRDPCPELRRLCSARGVAVVEVAYDASAPRKVNKERWRLYSEHVAASSRDVDRVVAADVRDLFFQRDPSTWLDENLGDHELVTSSEGVAYEDEPWNRGHAISVYGQEFYERHLKERLVVCAGLVAGLASSFRELCDEIYAEAYRAPHDSSDQVVLNGVLATTGEKWRVLATTDEHGWGCHGAILRKGQSPPPKLRWPPPVVRNGEVCYPSGRPYAVVHQYDRVPAWKDLAERRLADEDRRCSTSALK